MAMGKGEVLLESTDLFVNLLNLFKGSGGDSLRGPLGQFLKGGGAKIIAQQMPKLFGIGFSDNSLTLDILQRTEKVNPGSAAKLEKLTNGMTDYERYFFWMTITSIQIQKVTAKKKNDGEKGKEAVDNIEELILQPVSDAELDNRVQSLIFIVKLFEQHEENAAATIAAMHSLRVIEQSWVLRIWNSFARVIKESFLEPNGVASVNELWNSQSFLNTLKKRNEELRADLKQESRDHPSIFVWGLLWTQGGTRGMRFKDVYEVHTIIQFIAWLKAQKKRKAPANEPFEYIPPTLNDEE